MAMLTEHANSIASQGKINKTSINYNLFAKLKIQFFLVEFLDKVYEFKKPKTFEFNEIDFEINSVCHIPENFHEIQPPIITLILLFGLLNYGTMAPVLQQIQKQEPPTHPEMKQDEKFSNPWAKLQTTLTIFQGLFHLNVHRKNNKTMFLSGAPNIFKTTILKNLLQALVGLQHVYLMSRLSSKFNLGNLRKQQDSPYLLVMDDLRWENLCINIPDFLNLLDGTFVITEQKYQQETTGQLKKNLAITLNQTLEKIDLIKIQML